MQESDYNLILKIQVMLDHSVRTIDVGLFDTPLQLAYKFCQDNKIQLIEFRKISKSIIMIIKAAIDSNSLLENKQRLLLDSFQKYFQDVESTLLHKDIYTFEELLGETRHQHDNQVEEIKQQGDHHTPPQEEQSLSFRNNQINQLQQKLYQMYILSPDSKEDKEQTEPDDSCKRLRQLNFLHQILGEPIPIENLFLSNDLQPPLFSKIESIEQSYHKSRIPSITTSTIKHTTPIKIVPLQPKQKSTYKKPNPKDNISNNQSLIQSKKISNVLPLKSSFSPFRTKKILQQKNLNQSSINSQIFDKMKSISQSPISHPTKKVQLSKSPYQAPKQLLKRPNTPYFQCGPEKKVHQLLQRLISGKKIAGFSPMKNGLSPLRNVFSPLKNLRQTSQNLHDSKHNSKNKMTQIHGRFQTECDQESNSINQQDDENEELENKKSQQLYKIFYQIDSDQDGLISPQKVELSNLTDEILNYILDLLYEIDQFQMEVNFRQFCKMFEKHYTKLPDRSKQQFLKIQVNQCLI